MSLPQRSFESTRHQASLLSTMVESTLFTHFIMFRKKQTFTSPDKETGTTRVPYKLNSAFELKDSWS